MNNTMLEGIRNQIEVVEFETIKMTEMISKFIINVATECVKKFPEIILHCGFDHPDYYIHSPNLEYGVGVGTDVEEYIDDEFTKLVDVDPHLGPTILMRDDDMFEELLEFTEISWCPIVGEDWKQEEENEVSNDKFS